MHPLCHRVQPAAHLDSDTRASLASVAPALTRRDETFGADARDGGASAPETCSSPALGGATVIRPPFTLSLPSTTIAIASNARFVHALE